MKIISQKDIALRLGIDRSLVAHALRGDPRVSTATRRKVEEVAQEMGYNSYSNMAARTLVGRRTGKKPKTGVIAVVTASHFENVMVYDVPFIRSLLQGIELEAVEQEVDIFLCHAYERRLPRFITDQSVDGVICLHKWPEEFRSLQAKHPLPLLRVGDYAPGEWALTVQETAGMRAITQLLIDQGHRRIAYLGDVREGCPDRSARDKYEGYIEAFQNAGLSLHPELIDLDLQAPMIANGACGMHRLLDRTTDFTAVVCHNDSIAMGAMQAALERGFSVPRDMSIVGFDDVSEHYPCPVPLTSVSYDRVAIGRRAVQMIYRQFHEGESGDLRTHETFPTHIVQRKSTAPVFAAEVVLH